MERRRCEPILSLIEAQGLKQQDQTEIVSQGIVSDILSGKRQLNPAPNKIAA